MARGRRTGTARSRRTFLPETFLDAVRLRTRVDAYVVRTLEHIAHPPLEQDGAAPRALRTTVVGVQPVRILVFGGGLAAGYGVEDLTDALDHALARRCSDATGRGCSVQNRARRHVGLPDAVASLGAVGTHTYHAAVWSPSFVEATRRLSLRSWATELHGMIRDLRHDRAVPTVPLVLLEMPYPGGSHPIALLGRPWVQRINAVIRLVASEHDQVVAVATAPILARDPGQVVIRPDYYRVVADDLTRALTGMLGNGRPAAAGPERSVHGPEAATAG